ncbi:serine protease [Actinosynnema sp. NPDC023658]|uniref:S1 family peptidase n=1 Tax=Actinosynnema sp. NPDC023658 TaxID=3155465 RepID=UPI00340E9A25
MSVQQSRTAAQDYWVELRHASRSLGAAFFLTRRFVVTAAHCLRSVEEDDAALAVAFADGVELPARVHERLPEADLAVVVLLGPSPVTPLRADRCQPDDPWRVPSRPTPSDPILTGAVVEPAMTYTCAGGAQLKALQLRTEALLGDYSGYSGGPVERVLGSERTLAGVLFEQYPDRQDPTRASNVLLAATAAEVLARFDCFDMSNVLGELLDTPSKSNAEPAFHDVLDRSTALLKQGAAWQQQGLMPPEEVTAMRLRVTRGIVDLAIGQGQQ